MAKSATKIERVDRHDLKHTLGTGGNANLSESDGIDWVKSCWSSSEKASRSKGEFVYLATSVSMMRG
jgi:hypothetical protein